MTTLHGEPVAAGDTVYDVSIGRGAGRVSRIVNGAIECNFGTVRAIYNSDGRQRAATMVTLFWHNPIVEIPVKNNDVWASQLALARAVKTELLKHLPQ
jgi:hypothetical protein